MNYKWIIEIVVGYNVILHTIVSQNNSIFALNTTKLFERSDFHFYSCSIR